MTQNLPLKITKRAVGCIIGKSRSSQTGLILDADTVSSPGATAIARVGSPATNTLMQIIDRLAGGPGMTAAEVLAMVADENRQLEQMIEIFRSEAAADKSPLDLPASLPTLPIESLIEKVAAIREPKPKSAKQLLRFSRRLAEKRAKREAAWRTGHDFVMNEAVAERLALHARTKRAPTEPFGPVPTGFLLGGATIDMTLRHLGCAPPGSECAFPRSIIAASGDRSVAYFDVLVMADEFNQLIRGRLPVRETRPIAAKRAEIENWYRDVHVASHTGAGIKPSRDADLDALRRRFGHKQVSRNLARELRRKHAPATWRGGGAPKKSGRK